MLPAIGVAQTRSAWGNSDHATGDLLPSLKLPEDRSGSLKACEVGSGREAWIA